MTLDSLISVCTRNGWTLKIPRGNSFKYVISAHYKGKTMDFEYWLNTKAIKRNTSEKQVITNDPESFIKSFLQ